MKYTWLFLSLLCICGCSRSQDDRESPLVSIQIQDRNGLTETISNPDRLEIFETVDFLASQPFKKVLRVYRQKGKHTAKITTYHPNGQTWQYLETQDMRAFGGYREWHPNGQLKIEATVIGGTADINPGAQQDWLFDGTAKVFDEEGHLIAEIPYEKGVMEGKTTYFYPNGQIQRELPYHNNLLEGEALEFLLDGQLKSKTQYQAGLKHGQSLGFWPEEKTAWTETYQTGLLLEGDYFNLNGERVSEVRYKQGYQTLFNGPALEQVIEIRKGKPEGIVKEFTASGELKSSHHIKNGKKQGEQLDYYLSAEREEGSQDPLPKISIPWIDDAVSGIVKTWYPNGKLESQRELSRNKKMGPSFAWYRDGGLMYMEEYEEDRLLKGTYYKKNQKDPISSITNGNGLATLYDEQGIFIRKIPYIKGKAVDPEN